MLKVTQEQFPDVIFNVEVDIATNASASADLALDIYNLREQVLIALFGISVVNMQAGGADVVSSFTVQDLEAFIKLRQPSYNRVAPELNVNRIYACGMDFNRQVS